MKSLSEEYYDRKFSSARPTLRELELASALKSLVQWVEEAVPGQDVRFYNRVLRDEFLAGEKATLPEDYVGTPGMIAATRWRRQSVTERETDLVRVGYNISWATEDWENLSDGVRAVLSFEGE